VQEERLEVNREWALRFRNGLAESLSEKKKRADRITEEKQRIQNACLKRSPFASSIAASPLKNRTVRSERLI